MRAGRVFPESLLFAIEGRGGGAARHVTRPPPPVPQPPFPNMGEHHAKWVGKQAVHASFETFGGQGTTLTGKESRRPSCPTAGWRLRLWGIGPKRRRQMVLWAITENSCAVTDCNWAVTDSTLDISARAGKQWPVVIDGDWAVAVPKTTLLQTP